MYEICHNAIANRKNASKKVHANTCKRRKLVYSFTFCYDLPQVKGYLRIYAFEYFFMYVLPLVHVRLADRYAQVR